MDTLQFTPGLLDDIFPFYILFDAELTIISYGKSLNKIFPAVKKEDSLCSHFKAIRPGIEKLNADTVTENLNQLVILRYTGEGEWVIRGQFLLVGGFFLFAGSPWLTSVEDVKKNNLAISDFANHDPQLDLLQLLKSQETKNLELKTLLETNTQQREQLKKDKEELNRLSLVASDNKNGIVFTNPEAKIFWCNDAYYKSTGFTPEDIIGKTPIEVGRAFNTDIDALKKMAGLFFKGQPFDVEITHGRKDGSFFWTRTKGQPVYDKDGNLLQYFAVIEDMTSEKEKEEQLILLSLIAEKNINAVVICDKNGLIEWVNSSFEIISGYSLAELKGKKPGPMLQGPESDPEAIAYLNEKIKNGQPFNCEIVNYSKQGKKYWVKIQGQALFDKWGAISRFFAIEEDVTEKKKLETQKEELLASLEKSNNDLEEYAQIVSHDLKSPLRSINSLIFWIKEDDDQLSSKSIEYLNLIEGKVEKMDKLIQGILMYSKIDSEMVAACEYINTHDIVKGIIDTIEIPANVTVHISESLPMVLADKFRMHQLFQNLLGNAVSYIDKPEGIIEVDAKEYPENYVFSIKDNGPGIAEEHHEKIFKTFQSLTKNERATGLGLAIVKKIVDYYGGRIWLESGLGEGTTFYVQLNK